MKRKNIILSLVMAAFIGIMSVCAWFKPAGDFSEAERRKLSQLPELSFKTVLSGRFMKDFESYTLDQFPLRDSFRSLKAQFALNVFGRSANNDIYTLGNHSAKMDYPLNLQSVDRAAQRFSYVYDKYLKDSGAKVYLSLIPDKNFFMAQKAGQLSYDYEQLKKELLSRTPWAQYIDIFPLLELEDYYLTDAHWSQDKILPAAQALLEAMGAEFYGDYELRCLDSDFYGIYYGQSALNLKPDRISYLYSPRMDSWRVYDYQNGREIPVYNSERAEGRDPYEFFLNGPLSLLSIENPQGEKGRELIVFRDSFGSSIAPLLASGYEKITLADIRYIHPDMLSKFLDFGSQDVLFLYSTGVINNSETIK